MATANEKRNAIRALEVNGRVSPSALIEAARDPEHPCHDDFTWDDAVAAAERRHDQARAVIRSFRVEIETDYVTLAVPEYVPDPVRLDDCFRSMNKIRSQTDIAAMMDRELRALHGLACRVLAIAESRGHASAEDMRTVCQLIRVFFDFE